MFDPLSRVIFALFAGRAEEKLDGEPKCSVSSPGFSSNLPITRFYGPVVKQAGLLLGGY
jgi:hypothetical protein